MGRLADTLLLLGCLSIAYMCGKIKGREEALYDVAVGKPIIKEVAKKYESRD